MGRWIGRALMAIAVLHTAFAAVVFARTWRALLGDGLLDAVGNDPLRGAVAWFTLFGLLLFALGLSVDAQERAGLVPSRTLGLTLAVLVVGGIVLMPASGFWLALPPVAALLWPRRARAVAR